MYAFSFIALFILVLASINFMNLATARSITRSTEIGIRKVVGANRFQVIKQFFGESILLTIIASILAIMLTEVILSQFNTYTSKHINIDYLDVRFLLSFIAIILTTSLFSGLYPALYLSSFNPISVLKSRFITGSSKANFRKNLVILQFILSIFFIICTMVMSEQINYIRNFGLGMDIDNVIYVRMEDDIRNKYDIVKTELEKNPNIYSVCSASKLPNAILSGSYYQWGLNDNHPRRMCHIHVDYDFLKTFDIKMSQGRFYEKEYSTDLENTLIVNECAIKKVGIEDPLNQPFYFNES